MLVDCTGCVIIGTLDKGWVKTKALRGSENDIVVNSHNLRQRIREIFQPLIEVQLFDLLGGVALKSRLSSLTLVTIHLQLVSPLLPNLSY